jgi:hypothetical protein
MLRLPVESACNTLKYDNKQQYAKVTSRKCMQHFKIGQ